MTFTKKHKKIMFGVLTIAVLIILLLFFIKIYRSRFGVVIPAFTNIIINGFSGKFTPAVTVTTANKLKIPYAFTVNAAGGFSSLNTLYIFDTGPSVFNLGSNGLCINANVSFTNITTNQSLVYFKQSTGISMGDIQLAMVGPGKIKFVIYNTTIPSSFSIETPNNVIAADTYYQITAVYNPAIGPNGIMYLYINGVLQGTGVTPSFKFKDATYTSTFIGYDPSTVLKFTGKIKNIQVLNKPVSSRVTTFATPITLGGASDIVLGETASTMALSTPVIKISGPIITPTPTTMTAISTPDGATFNGIDQYIDFGPKTFNIGVAGFSVKANISFSTMIPSWVNIIDFGFSVPSTGQPGSIFVSLIDGVFLYYAIYIQSVRYTSVYYIIPENVYFKQMAAIYDPSTGGPYGQMTLYVNGSLVKTRVVDYILDGTPKLPPSLNYTTTLIGKTSEKYTHDYLKGTIKGLEVYNSAITDTDAKTPI